MVASRICTSAVRTPARIFIRDDAAVGSLADNFVHVMQAASIKDHVLHKKAGIALPRREARIC
jgi:hypothetical protein